MRRFLVLFLMIAIPFGSDCSDQMKLTGICHLTKANVKKSILKCHQENQTAKDSCECAKSKPVIISKSASDFVSIFFAQLTFITSTYVSFDLEKPLLEFVFVPKIRLRNSDDSYLETIHLLL
ncbi:hypothetical protein CLV96_3874 [Leptospira meyeri]|uniref:Uncharacterized protein n=2 Tax=Leptospira TaxID=171 RepID=A0A4R8MJF9_LEPME|nr:hypothetical protein CLV96_3874 [Leptospira meyeri]